MSSKRFSNWAKETSDGFTGTINKAVSSVTDGVQDVTAKMKREKKVSYGSSSTATTSNPYDYAQGQQQYNSTYGSQQLAPGLWNGYDYGLGFNQGNGFDPNGYPIPAPYGYSNGSYAAPQGQGYNSAPDGSAQQQQQWSPQGASVDPHAPAGTPAAPAVPAATSNTAGTGATNTTAAAAGIDLSTVKDSFDWKLNDPKSPWNRIK